MRLRSACLVFGLVALQAQAPMARISPSWQAQWALRSRWAPTQMTRGAMAAPAWRAATGQTDLPALFDGSRVLLVHAAPKKVQALDPLSGQVQWEAPFAGLLDGPLQLGGDRILCPLEGGRLALLDPATGAMRLLLRLPAWMPAPEEAAPPKPRMLFPCRAGDLVLAGWSSPSTEPRPQRSLFAFDAGSGDLRWSAALPSGSDVHPLVHEGLVLAAGGGQARALRLGDGSLAWTAALPRRGPLDSAQLLGGHLLLRSSEDIVALDATTGRVLWSQPLRETSLLVGEGGVLALLATRGTFAPETWLMALDARTGRTLWEREVSGARLPWIQDGALLLNDGETVLSLELATGKERWRKALGGPLLAPLQLQGDQVLALFRAKGQPRILGFRLGDGGEAFLAPVQDRLGTGPLLASPGSLLLPLAEGGVVAYR